MSLQDDRDLTRRVLKNPDYYPPEFKSAIPKILNVDPTYKLLLRQLPDLSEVIDPTVNSLIASAIADEDAAVHTWVNSQNFATQTFVTSQGYATQTWVTSQGYATQAWVLSQNYATQGWVTSQGYSLESKRPRVIASDFTTYSITLPDGSTHALGPSLTLPGGTLPSGGAYVEYRIGGSWDPTGTAFYPGFDAYSGGTLIASFTMDTADTLTTALVLGWEIVVRFMNTSSTSAQKNWGSLEFGSKSAIAAGLARNNYRRLDTSLDTSTNKAFTLDVAGHTGDVVTVDYALLTFGAAP